MPIIYGNTDKTLVITNMMSTKHEVGRHLMNLGFRKGQLIKVVSKTDSGIVVLVCGARIALDNLLASRIHGIEI